MYGIISGRIQVQLAQPIYLHHKNQEMLAHNKEVPYVVFRHLIQVPHQEIIVIKDIFKKVAEKIQEQEDAQDQVIPPPTTTQSC